MKQIKAPQYICLYCGDQFTPTRADSRFCSTRCHKAFYQQGYNEEHRGTDCKFNDAVTCSKRTCDTCGWNPAVSAARIAELKKSHITNED